MSENLRLLCICGHPDDETIHMGGTLARYANAGATVVCVTATRGELGEIVDRDLATPTNYLRLGELRMEEMALALGRLGPIEARWLGYRDSGTQGDARSAGGEALCGADPDEVAGRIARVIREVRPQVVLTLPTSNGGGHPDHLQAALATRVAFERASDPAAWPDQLAGPNALGPWTPTKLYEWRGQSRTPLTNGDRIRFLIRDRGLLGAAPVIARAALRMLPTGRRQAAEPASASVIARPSATTQISVREWTGARDAAIRAYRSQIPPSAELLALTPVEVARLSPTEDFTLLEGPAPTGIETDLFAGLAVVTPEAVEPATR